MTSAADMRRRPREPGFWTRKRGFEIPYDFIFGPGLFLAAFLAIIVLGIAWEVANPITQDQEQAIDQAYDRAVRLASCERATQDRTACYVAIYHAQECPK